MSTIRDQIREAMKRAKLTVRGTARKAGISAGPFGEWLAGNGPRRLGDKQLEAIAGALGAQWLLLRTRASDTVSLAQNMEENQNARTDTQTR